MLNVEDIKESIAVGNGKSMMATIVESLKFRVIQLNGFRLDIALVDINYVPELWVDLFSINKVLKNGYLLSSVSVTFDRVMRTRND
jgi:hypothetical protein